MRVGLYLHPRGMLAIQSLRLPPPFQLRCRRLSDGLRHLRYFTAVVECKGYREASRRLHIAQPSISQAVSDLEDELGLKLFSRSGRNARLRPEGEIFYADAVRILTTGGDYHPHCQASSPRQSW